MRQTIQNTNVKAKRNAKKNKRRKEGKHPQPIPLLLEALPSRCNLP